LQHGVIGERFGRQPAELADNHTQGFFSFIIPSLHGRCQIRFDFLL
jgi:hypothetical protein